MLKFGKFFRGQQKDEPQEQEVVKQPEQVEVKEEKMAPDIPSLEVKDDLYILWQKWRPHTIPPRLKISGDRPLADMLLNIPELERERLRISLKMNQEAKKRVRDIQNMEAKGEVASLPAECRCYVSRDKLLAWLFVYPPVGDGEKLSAAAAGKVMQENHIVNGMDFSAAVSVAKEENYFKLIPVAFGVLAEEGKDGYVEELFAREIVKEVKLDENGTADYRIQNYVQIIEENQVICRIYPPVEGKEGLRLDGTPIKPKSVRAAKAPKGNNTKLNEDGTALLAAATGHLEYHNEAFQVNPVLDVPGDVDYSTGNIDFPGDVHIRGNVREGFSVKATGSVAVDGLVEAATVEADGDLLITCGVVGDNHALLRSKSNIRTKYLENCEIYAGGDIYADCIVTSRLFCDGSVSVMSGPGSIIGGTLTVGEGILARTLGARSGRETELCLGIRPSRKNTLAEIEQEMDKLRQEIERSDKDLAYLERRYSDRPDESRLVQAKADRKEMETKEAELMQRHEAASVQLLDLSKCRIECEMAYPVITVTIDGHVWTINSPRKFYKVIYDKSAGELREIL